MTTTSKETRAGASSSSEASDLPWRRAGDPPIERTDLVIDYSNDSEGAARVVIALADEYVRFVEYEHAMCSGCPVDRSGPFIVHSMLDWKATYADGRLGEWSYADIHDYMLDHFPRKISGGAQLLLDTPTSVRDFVYFMGDRGTFTASEVESLKDVADRLSNTFVAANRDRSNWGMAKSFVMGGSPPLARPMDVGPSFVDVQLPASTVGDRVPDAGRRSRRKAVRSARRRNRR